jgi:hypothetical protein
MLKMGRPEKNQRADSLHDSLLLILRDKKPKLRTKILHEWRIYELKAALKREPTVLEMEKQIKWLRELNVKTALNTFFRLSESLKDFVPIYQEQKRIEKARNAAIKMWSKENRKKRKENKKIS